MPALHRMKDPAGPKAKTWNVVIGILNVVWLVSLILVINILQMATVLLLPFSRKLFMRINRGFANLWWGMVVFLMERGAGMEFIYTGDVLPEGESGIVIANHQGMIDIPVIMATAWRKRRLGDLKFFVKDILKWVPGIGWGMVFLGCLFLKRNWYADRSRIRRTFSRIVDNGVPVWLVSFVEGTRIKNHKLAASQEYARKAGLPVTEYVMVPRYKGFVGSVEGLRGHAQAVYDVTIGYPDGLPSLWQLARAFPRAFHVHLRRYPMSEIPEGSEEAAQWLFGIFEEKDALLKTFYETGRFPGEPLDEPYRTPFR